MSDFNKLVDGFFADVRETVDKAEEWVNKNVVPHSALLNFLNLNKPTSEQTPLAENDLVKLVPKHGLSSSWNNLPASVVWVGNDDIYLLPAIDRPDGYRRVKFYCKTLNLVKISSDEYYRLIGESMI